MNLLNINEGRGIGEKETEKERVKDECQVLDSNKHRSYKWKYTNMQNNMKNMQNIFFFFYCFKLRALKTSKLCVVSCEDNLW